MAHPITQKLILHASGAATGDPTDTLGHTDVTFQINSVITASGATIKIQGSNDGNVNWADITSDQVITASGATVVSVTGKYYENVRANISSHTDGEFYVYMAASGFASVK